MNSPRGGREKNTPRWLARGETWDKEPEAGRSRLIGRWSLLFLLFLGAVTGFFDCRNQLIGFHFAFFDGDHRFVWQRNVGFFDS